MPLRGRPGGLGGGLREHGFTTIAVNGLRHLAQRPLSNQARLLDYAIAYARSRAADVIDLDVYPYFCPISEAVRMLPVHDSLAVHRAVAEHLGKPAGFYVELDDRNCPFQINPVEASAECAWTCRRAAEDCCASRRRPVGSSSTGR